MRAQCRKVRVGLFAALVAAGVALAAPVAGGQPILCGERAAMLERLKEKYDEKRTAFGLSSDGHLVEVFAAPSGTWTMLVTYPGGPTCLVTSGVGWQQIDHPARGAGLLARTSHTGRADRGQWATCGLG